MSWRDRQLAGAIAICLLGFYLLTFSGKFHSSDGFSMYTVADSLARYGRLDTEQIRWMGLQQGTFGPDGRLYSRKGLATSLLALPLVWLGLTVPDIGPVHAALLLTPILTALTGAYLFLAARRAYSGMALPLPWAPLAVTLAWGLGSMAWPYAKTFFSEPLVALTIAASAYHIVAFRDTRAWHQAAWVGGWLGLGLLARAANAIVIPGFGLALLAFMAPLRPPAPPPGTRGGRERIWRRYWRERALWQPIVAFVLPIALFGLLSLGYNWFRFGDPLESGYLEAESFSAIWIVGIVGQLFSPGRGLLWYTPWLVLIPLALRPAWRRDRVLTALCLGQALLYLLFYGKWYMWHGGFAWGSRFLVPILPLLALLCPPLFLRPARSTVIRLFVALALLGALVNLVGVLWDFMPQQQALDAAGFPLFDPVTFFHPRWAQIPGVLALGSRAALDPIWAVDGQVVGRMLALGLGMAAIGLLILGGALLERQGTWVSAGVVLLAAFAWLLLGDARAFQSADMQAIAAEIEAAPFRDASIWLDDIEGTATFLNIYRGRLPIEGLVTGGERLPEEAAARAPTLVAQPRPVWLVSDGPERGANGLDALLLAAKALASDERHGPLRLALYHDRPAPPGLIVVNRDFAPPGEPAAPPLLRLRDERLTPTAQPGGVVAIDLTWEALRPISEDYQIFAHLVRADDPEQRVAQQDGPPVNGLRPTSTWQPGETLRDRRALRLSPTLPPGAYQLRIGLYRLSDGARLVSPDGRDVVEIGPIEVRR